MDESERTLHWHIALILLLGLLLIAEAVIARGMILHKGWYPLLFLFALALGLRLAIALVRGRIPSTGLTALLIGAVIVLSGWNAGFRMWFLWRAIRGTSAAVLAGRVGLGDALWPLGNSLSAFLLVGVVGLVLFGLSSLCKRRRSRR